MDPAATVEVTFAQLGLTPVLVEALEALGYEEPTPIQRAALPVLLEGKDLLGVAATGTGKTAAFALPLLQRLSMEDRKPATAAALVLVPTRELAMQVAEAIHRYGQRMGVRVLPIYGGQPMGQQLRSLQRGVDVVVATPGRAMDHLRRGTLNLKATRMVVLDEADEMLDMGFAEDLEALLEATPEERQTALFSATLPPRITTIAERHLRKPVRVRISREKLEPGEAPKVRQSAYIVPRAFKDATLGRILDVESPTTAIIFCRTRTEVDTLTVALNGRGWRALALHGGLSQEQRDRVIKQLKARSAELLVATDVAARGLHIDKLSHVFNYDVPSAPEAYVHRIGRTGRAGREGVAITLAEPREHRLLRNIEKLTGQRIEVATVPTVADLRARRLELLRASLREALVEGGLDSYRPVVESLAAEFDAMEVAAAAVKLLRDAREDGRDDDKEEEIPTVAPPTEKRARPSKGPSAEGRPASEGRPVSKWRTEAPAGEAPRSAKRRAGPPPEEAGDMVRLYIGAGRTAGMRPADLVGAITNEAGVEGKQIGTIQIGDAYSLVEVPEALANQVITALRDATLRGKKVPVRRDRS
jgi:ATP-dependent RNA helicase DeaD